MAAWKNEDCTNNGCSFSSTRKEQEDKRTEALGEHIGASGWGFARFWGEESSGQRGPKMAAERPAGAEGCRRMSD